MKQNPHIFPNMRNIFWVHSRANSELISCWFWIHILSLKAEFIWWLQKGLIVILCIPFLRLNQPTAGTAEYCMANKYAKCNVLYCPVFAEYGEKLYHFFYNFIVAEYREWNFIDLQNTGERSEHVWNIHRTKINILAICGENLGKKLPLIIWIFIRNCLRSRFTNQGTSWGRVAKPVQTKNLTQVYLCQISCRTNNL
jgi:hypothetical protein